MPRRKSFSSIIKQASRESARAQRQLEAEQKRREREYAKAITTAQKLAKEEYLATRIEEVENINLEIKNWLQDIQNILPSALDKNSIVEFDSLRIKRTFPSYQIPKELKDSKTAPKFQRPDAPPDWISNLFPCVKRRYINALKKADSEYQAKRLFRVQGDKLSQYLGTARFSANLGKVKCISQYSFNHRSGRASEKERI